MARTLFNICSRTRACRRIRGRSFATALACTTLLFFGRALAHGGPPEALAIVAADADGTPSVVLLNEGLALMQAGTWAFLCPSAWGNSETTTTGIPLAMSPDGQVSYVIGADDLYVLRDGMLLPQQSPMLSRSAVVALAADTDGIYGLQVTSDGSAIVRIDDAQAPARFTSSEHWSTLAIDPASGHAYLTRQTDAPSFVVLIIDRDGQEVDEVEVGLTAPVARVRVRATPDGLLAVAFDGSQYVLAKLKGTALLPMAESPIPFAGPLVTDMGATFVSVDGELMRVAASGLEAVGEERRVTCLGQVRGLRYACTATELYRFDDGGLQEPLFQLDGIASPPPDLVPMAAARTCNYQWQLFRNDLSMIGLTAREFEEAAMPASEMPAADDMPAAGMAAPTPSGTVAPTTKTPMPNAANAPATTDTAAPLVNKSDDGCSVGGSIGRSSSSRASLLSLWFGWLALAWVAARFDNRFFARGARGHGDGRTG